MGYTAMMGINDQPKEKRGIYLKLKYHVIYHVIATKM